MTQSDPARAAGGGPADADPPPPLFDPRPEPPKPAARKGHFWRYVLIGFFTVAPLWVTWIVFDILVSLLARTGAPMLRALAAAVRPLSQWIADLLLLPTLQYVLAALFTLGALYLVGLAASFVLGQRLLGYLERLVMRLPLVQTTYNATKRFLQAFRKPPARGQRVVLINFPSPQMKALAFVTKILQDKTTGRDLAVVYVPTSPNPTSGYIELLPLEEVVQTDWTVEEAMTFIVTGGTNAPPGVHFTAPGAPAQEAVRASAP